MKYLSHKGYTGTIEYSTEDELLFGKVIGIKGLISYKGKTGKALEKDFRFIIDEYLADCKTQGVGAEKPFKGSFNVRMPAELHRSAALKAMEMKTSLNSYVTESVRHSLMNEPGEIYKKVKKTKAK